MKLFKLTLAIAMGAIFMAGATAQAATFSQSTQDMATGKYLWSEQDNWTGGSGAGGMPAAGDTAVIPETLVATVNDTSAVAGKLDIQNVSNSGAKVEIIAGGKLTLNNNGNAELTSTIADDTSLVLTSSTSVVELDNDDHIFSGSGKIIGEHNDAEIREISGETRQLTLTSFTMSGAMKVDLDLVNNGKVIADDGTTATSRDTLELFRGIFTGSGEWHAIRAFGANTAILQVRSGVTASAPTGAFKVSADSKAVFNESFTTTGNLTFDGGKIVVAAGKTFTAS